jgi:hypothetical protein
MRQKKGERERPVLDNTYIDVAYNLLVEPMMPLWLIIQESKLRPREPCTKIRRKQTRRKGKRKEN